MSIIQNWLANLVNQIQKNPKALLPARNRLKSSQTAREAVVKWPRPKAGPQDEVDRR